VTMTSPVTNMAFNAERAMIKRYESGDCKTPYHKHLWF
jgi:hypothetical protein